ncbi:hypothetical protein VTK73DRAFT_5401 [Phialemonium thermophilum]|uniref:CRIB domain-containing protein n=1 Tax=Phialemonium thermophilum TaxID=223376 RepID=A0ABR3WP02_9PEZI
MNMFIAPTLPVYSVERGAKSWTGKKTTSTDIPDSLKQTVGTASPPAQTLPGTHTQSVESHDADYFEPAMEGPPSPESIRALSKQMKRASILDKHHSHQTTSSGSSSLRSLVSGDRESISLSRKSSGRSTSSSMPSTRDRPESVQIFGKTIFNRRGRLRRESNAAQSSSEMGYASPVPPPPPPPPSAATRESGVAGLFGRRRTLRSDASDESAAAAAAQRKLQISGPYNFQHVTHTQRDHVRHMSRPGLVRSTSDFSHASAAEGGPRGYHGDPLHFADFSSEALPIHEQADEFVAQGPRTRISLHRPVSTLKQANPRRLLKHQKSREMARVPPPRPPRSPLQPEHDLSPPVPPPRISSRLSMRYENLDAFGNPELERPQTSGSFRYSRPFYYSPEATGPPATSYGYPSARSGLEALPEHRVPYVADAAENNWPLPSFSPAPFETPLSGVPEEDEGSRFGRRSRASLASNASSSLRGSHSVPLLRQLSLGQKQENKRPSSGASETLGRFDLFAAQRALRAEPVEEDGADPIPRESWEDDIDYCYEHEAEADFNYDWGRPSLDIARDSDSVTPVEGTYYDEKHAHGGDPPSMLSPGRFDVPALSPTSHASSATMHEAITPTAPSLPPTSSHAPEARLSQTQQSRSLHVGRRPSDASSFKESHGFTLSPSLLIPADYRQQMLASESERLGDGVELLPGAATYVSGPTGALGESSMLRISASTTASNDTGLSASDRHNSSTSASTDLTRLTMSTNSLDIDPFLPKGGEPIVEPPPRFEDSEFFHVRAKSQGTMPMLREAAPDHQAPLRREMTHASDPNLVKLAMEAGPRSPGKRKDPLHTRRRARTTSLSTPPPPGQYALFPSVLVTSPRI